MYSEFTVIIARDRWYSKLFFGEFRWLILVSKRSISAFRTSIWFAHHRYSPKQWRGMGQEIRYDAVSSEYCAQDRSDKCARGEGLDCITWKVGNRFTQFWMRNMTRGSHGDCSHGIGTTLQLNKRTGKSIRRENRKQDLHATLRLTSAG